MKFYKLGKQEKYIWFEKQVCWICLSNEFLKGLFKIIEYVNWLYQFIYEFLNVFFLSLGSWMICIIFVFQFFSSLFDFVLFVF